MLIDYPIAKSTCDLYTCDKKIGLVSAYGD